MVPPTVNTNNSDVCTNSVFISLHYVQLTVPQQQKENK